MRTVENECVGCGSYCVDCGAKHVVYYVCDRCDNSGKIRTFGDEELCTDCIEKALSSEETEDGVCEECGDEDKIYVGWGLCRYCLLDGLEEVDECE